MKNRMKKTAAWLLTAAMTTGLMGGTVTVSAAEDYSGELPQDYEGTLTMWGWDDTWYEAMTKAFNEKYPNVKFEYTPMANGDTLQKYQTAIASGTELPDIGWAIIDSRAKVFELDMWEDLSADPYNFDINEVYEFTHPKLVNSKGQVCGIENGLNPAGLAYRKDLAKEYLGTDDREELEAMFPTWEAFIEKGKEVYEKSGGEIHMLQGIADAQQFIREQDGKSWIEDGVIKVTDALQRSLELACELRDNNVVDKLEAWSPAWYASFGEGKHIFGGCATWSIPFNIVPNDPEGETTGHWGLMSAPEGNISWGGTTIGISKTCEDKRLAWEFVKFATLSTEGAEALNSIGFLTSAKKPYEEKPELKQMSSPWFGDQDLGAMFMDEIIPNIKTRPMNFDDNVIHETLNLITTALNNDRDMTAEDAIEQLKEELEMKLPDYTVE
ncbi:extracellular solute-binding protein [Blautia schinkii]|nr:extracellular solute-binding protein [Blautia schinkii]